MNYSFVVPAARGKKETVSQDVLHLWRAAVFTIKQAQKKFVEAYKATLTDLSPGWQAKWQTEPRFDARLGEVEDYIKTLCLENGMELTVFNRYRSAARKHLLMDVPFKFAATNFTIDELKQIKEGGEDEAKALRKEKNVRHAATVVAKHATILPLPDSLDNQDDYLEMLKARLSQHFCLVKDKLGAEVCKRLIQELTVPPDEFPAHSEQIDT